MEEEMKGKKISLSIILLIIVLTTVIYFVIGGYFDTINKTYNKKKLEQQYKQQYEKIKTLEENCIFKITKSKSPYEPNKALEGYMLNGYEYKYNPNSSVHVVLSSEGFLIKYSRGDWIEDIDYSGYSINYEQNLDSKQMEELCNSIKRLSSKEIKEWATDPLYHIEFNSGIDKYVYENSLNNVLRQYNITL